MEFKRAVLDVETSVTGYFWRDRGKDERLAIGYAQQLGLPEIVGRVLVNRDVSPDELQSYLDPRLKDLMPDPSSFADMDRAAERVARAITSGEKITIFGDYDVDGATSSSLLCRYISAAGGQADFYIPDRMAEGYGPNLPALQKIAGAGADLIITVDCGISAFDVLDGAADQGIEVVVVDHHMAEPRLPKAVAVVNPNRLDCDSGQGKLAAVGVAFLLAVAVNRTLRGQGWFGGHRREPDLRHMLDLVALGTVCDVVPLHGLNRAFVTQGLKVLARRGNVGLGTLSDVARVNGPPGTYHAGFLLGPRVNAGGRVGRSDLGTQLMLTSDAQEAVGIAYELDRLNKERQAIEAEVLQQALEMAGKTDPGPVAVIAGEGWHPGVIGIVASRLKDKLNRPAFVISLDGEQGKGSGRSIPGVDLGAAVTAARQADLLVNGGGHAMAAGLTVVRDRVDELRTFFADRLRDKVETATAEKSKGVDGVVSAPALNLQLAQQLEMAGPYGAGNPEPRLAVAEARIVRADIVGEKHVRMILSDAGGQGRQNAIAFRAVETALATTLLSHAEHRDPVHLLGYLRVDHFRGEARAQFVVEDAAAIM